MCHKTKSDNTLIVKKSKGRAWKSWPMTQPMTHGISNLDPWPDPRPMKFQILTHDPRDPRQNLDPFDPRPMTHYHLWWRLPEFTIMHCLCSDGIFPEIFKCPEISGKIVLWNISGKIESFRKYWKPWKNHNISANFIILSWIIKDNFHVWGKNKHSLQ